MPNAHSFKSFFLLLLFPFEVIMPIILMAKKRCELELRCDMPSSAHDRAYSFLFSAVVQPPLPLRVMLVNALLRHAGVVLPFTESNIA